IAYVKDYVSLDCLSCSNDHRSELLSFLIEKRRENVSIWAKFATWRPTNTT
ncbi:unnamed protein product, partial [Rotaria sp. Silwood1]